MRICLLTYPARFLADAPLCLGLTGLTRVHSDLSRAFSHATPPSLILAADDSPAYHDYLARREHDETIASVPLTLFRLEVTEDDRTRAHAIGATDVLATKHGSPAAITQHLAWVLSRAPRLSPLPTQPFAFQRINQDTYRRVTAKLALPRLDDFCREEGGVPTPIVAVSHASPPRLLGLFETAEAARAYPSASQIKQLVDLRAQLPQPAITTHAANINAPTAAK